MRRDVRVAEVVEGRLEVLQVGGRQVRAPGVLDPDQGDLAVGRDDPGVRRRTAGPRRVRRPGRSCRAPWAAPPRLPGPWPRRPALGGVEEVLRRVARREDDVGAEAHVAGAGPRQQLGGALRVEPGCLERVVELPTERSRGGQDHEADRCPGGDHDPGATGGEAAQSFECSGHGGLLGERPAWGTPASASTLVSPGVPTHRRRGRDAVVPSAEGESDFRPVPAYARRSLRWVGDQPAAVRAGRAARPVAAGAGVVGLGAGRRGRGGRRAGGHAAREPSASVAVAARDRGAGADTAVAAYASVHGGRGGLRHVRRSWTSG